MLNRDFNDILSAFSDEGVEYLLVGAYALAAHGVTRATADMDLWIRPARENAKRVFRALARFGAPLSEVTEADFATPELVFQIGNAPSRVDILTSLDGVEFEAAWKRRTTLMVEKLQIPVIGRADLIVNKRATGRPQDLADVERLVAGENADST